MKNTFETIWKRLALTSAATRAGMVAVTVGLVIAAVLAVQYSNQPHYEMLLSGLDDAETARVGEALAGAGVQWRSSQPPGPFVVYVDEEQLTLARNAVFAAGALRGHDGGIITEASGLATLLLGSQERQQIMRKRIWEEMERMLELQDFVQEAKVQTMVPEGRVFGRQPRITASVTLVTRGGQELTRKQAQTVARLVRFGLGIAEEDLVIADDQGKSLFDGLDLASGAGMVDDWLSAGEEADRRLEVKAADVLDSILGPGLAKVAVRSEWDFTTSTTLADTATSNAAALVSERVTSTTDPRFASDPVVGGAAGSAGNLNTANNSFAAPDQSSVDVRSASKQQAPTEPALSKASEQERVYAPSRTLTTTEQRTPKLARMSIALYIDSSVSGTARTALENAVKATVGFSQARGDEFQFAQLTFAKPEAVEGDAAATQSEGLPPIVGVLLDRGVEIVLGIAFSIFLLRAWRGSSKARKLREQQLAEIREQELAERKLKNERLAAQVQARAEEAESPLMQARPRVAALVGEEPDKVGELLSAWVRDARKVSAN
jgi:flagellar M-ring protein FliF